MIDNEVVIIGGDHHNTLALIRNFGRNNIKFTILIHSSNIVKKNEINISYSKYAKKIDIIEENEKKIVDWLLNHKLPKKQIIFPSSDLAEYTIDKNYNTLKDYYIIPGFKDNPGKVVKLMNKFEQKKWADYHGIPTAKSWNIVKDNNSFNISEQIIFPCIIKPSISAQGSKSDISIVNNKNELDNALEKFNSKEYTNLIIQEFINKEYEICALGCITPDYNCGQIVRKIRENPPTGGGSLTFAKFINDKKINDFINKTILELKRENYQGLYDIEFFVYKDYIYLNEINFRHSGNGYALIKSGIMAPYILYLYFSNKEYKISFKGKLIYFIDDFNEWNLYRKKEISILTFINDFFKANSHSVFDIKDLGVFIHIIKKKILKK